METAVLVAIESTIWLALMQRVGWKSCHLEDYGRLFICRKRVFQLPAERT